MKDRTNSSRPAGTRAGWLTVLAASLIAAGSVQASLPETHTMGPRLVAPAPDATAYESGVRFAWEAPPNTARHLLLLSRAPFDPSGWNRIPEGADVEVHELARPVASLAELKVALQEDTRFYWSAASVEAGTGRITFSPVRSNFVLRRFANRVEPSPYLRTSPIGSAAPRAALEPESIRLSAGYTIQPQRGEPMLPEGLRATPGASGMTRTMLVYYGAGDPEAARSAILRAGGLVVAYIPDHTFLVRMGAGSTRSMALEDSWVGDYHPAYKLSPELSTSSDQPVTASVLVFPDGDLTAVAATVTAAGGRVILTSSNGINKILRVEAASAALSALAQHPDVAWIEPYVAPRLDNDQAQWVVQTNINGNRRLWDLGLKGEGQVVCTTDSGIDMTHQFFIDPLVPVTGFGDYPTHRKVIAYKLGSSNPAVEFGDHAGAVYHGTHTAGTVAGTDDNAAGASPFDGMAKNAKLFFMDISGTTLLNGVDPFPDLNDLFLPSYNGNAGGAARISSNSWGAPVNGVYNLNSLAVDQFMWNHPDYLIFISNGNSGPAGKVGAPASAKSSVGAGGTRNGTTANQIYSSTSRGPTTDGRRKPTFCSPGDGVTSSSVGPTGYAPLSGTSMASPSMTGAAALIRQYLTEGWYPTGTKVPANGFAPSAALLKAMCVNSADNGVTGFTAPDQNVGYGRIKADNVCYFAGDARRLVVVDNTAGLGHGQSIEYQVNVVNASQPLEVTLCWTDYPGDPAAAVQLVNNLDLTVTNGANTYKGNVYLGGFSTGGGAYDNRNVEEAVLVQSPSLGIWTVRIDAPNVPVGPQPFGLCVTGGVGSDAGTLALDRGSYGASSTVGIEVVDVNAGPSVNVTLSSTTEGSGETVALTGGNGIFTGSIPLSTLTGSSGDGLLQVSHGDVITATYVDASPVATLTVTAQVSFTTAVITDVTAKNQGNATVLVSWNTDLNSSSKVYYGLTPALGSATTLDPTALRTHQVLISGLQVGQTYYYDVESEELSGNVTRDDNGGAHYRFTVNPAGELLLVYGGVAFERANRYEAALGALGWSYDTWQGPLSDTPLVGNLTGGLRSYKAVWWQVGLEYYPPFSDAARDAVTQYLDGGGRLAVTGHDIAWALSDPQSPYFSLDRRLWLENTLHTSFNTDPAGWTSVTGIAADPISGAYTGGVPYAEHRAGGSGDEVDLNAGDGTGFYTWRSGEASPDDCGLRWESNGPRGTAGSAVWGGKPSRLAAMYFEWSSMDPSATTSSATRNFIMTTTLRWLMGRDKPVVVVTAPNGGETITADQVAIEWTEAIGGGAGVSARGIDYSLDGGASWVTLTGSAGPSPYLWNLTSIPNSGTARVRVRVTDNGDPTLSGADASDASFAIQRAGGDVIGPVVVAGSMRVNPNPIDNRQQSTLQATVSDLNTGGGDVAAAEWSTGASPSPGGSGRTMSGSFNGPTVAVSAVIPALWLNTGQHRLWVRGQDAAGNWGSATALQVTVNGRDLTGVGDTPAALELRQNAPNPVDGSTDIAFALPVEGAVSLALYDTQGRQVRELAGGRFPAGTHRVHWNGTDEAGRPVAAGVYYYRFEAAGRTFQRRMVVLR